MLVLFQQFLLVKLELAHGERRKKAEKSIGFGKLDYF